MSFSEDAWRAMGPWFDAICRHPFLLGLTDGTLSEETFTRYLVDDAHYLDRYARVLAQLAVRAPDPAGVELLAGSAVAAVAAERQLHREFLVPRGLDPDAGSAAEATPTCVAYTGFLESSAADSSYGVGLAAILPCFRVYAEVGRHILARRDPGDHPYAAWIETYAAPEFDEAVRRMEAHVDSVATDRAAMAVAYERSTRYEWMFWDAAWRAEAWPTHDVR